MTAMILPSSPTGVEVLDFLTMWRLKVPVYVDYQDVGGSYAPDFCHVSVKHAVQQRGGCRIHGWALWQFSNVIVGDFHSVWETPSGTLVDVTPPKLGNRVLFVPDPSLSIKSDPRGELLYHNRTNVPRAPRIWGGDPIADDTFVMPLDNASLVAYCDQLGLPDTSMI